MNDLAGTEPGFEKALKQLPLHIQPGVRNYVIYGDLPGNFLQAIICNDLRGAVTRADSTNILFLKEIIAFFNGFVPASAWGSSEKMLQWKAQGGLKCRT